jgi:hypothetical protein
MTKCFFERKINKLKKIKKEMKLPAVEQRGIFMEYILIRHKVAEY